MEISNSVSLVVVQRPPVKYSYSAPGRALAGNQHQGHHQGHHHQGHHHHQQQNQAQGQNQKQNQNQKLSQNPAAWHPCQLEKRAECRCDSSRRLNRASVALDCCFRVQRDSGISGCTNSPDAPNHAVYFTAPKTGLFC